MEKRYNLSYSIMDYIDFRTHPERPVIFKAGLDGKIRDEVIVLGNRTVKIQENLIPTDNNVNQMKKLMASPLHIGLLEKLKKAGIGVMVDVSPFINFHFHKPENPDHWKQAMRPPILFLRDLIKNDYIRLEEDDEYLNVIMHPHNTFIKWFSDIDIQVYITSNGLDYLDEYQNNRLLNNTNRAIIFCSITTLIFSAAIVLCTVLNYNLSNQSFSYAKKNDSTLKTVESRLDILSKKQLKH